MMSMCRWTRAEVYSLRALRMVWSDYWTFMTLKSYMRSMSAVPLEKQSYGLNRPLNPIMLL